MENKQIQGLYEFAGYRLDAKNCLLTREGEIVSLTPKEFDVLLLLVERAGQVVKKEELLDTVWKDAFVEEATLTRNISWLRKKLADGGGAASDAKIIETVPKRGYRFLPEVNKIGEDALIIEEQIVQQIEIEEIIEIAASHDSIEKPVRTLEENLETKGFETSGENLKALPAAPEKRRFSAFYVFLGALVLALVVFSGYRGYFFQSAPKMKLAAKVAPFSGSPGRETDPSFSPDGRQLVFSWNGGVENGNFDIYVKLVGAGDAVRLTDGAQNEINPVFSPDGRSIAFIRIFPDHNEIISISALGGDERRIFERASHASLSFSPDGKFLAHATLDLAETETGIFYINLETGEKTRLTMPEAPAVDHTPRFSPDGQNLAFIRYFSSFHREIFVVPVSGGEPRRITTDGVRIYGFAWDKNGENIFYTSFREAGQVNLWQISSSGGEPQLIPTGGRNLQGVSVSPDGKTIAFVEETENENIWAINLGCETRNAKYPNADCETRGAELKTETQKSETADRDSHSKIVASTRADHSQQFSPDGSLIAFASDRTGNYEIWLADADGKNQRKLTDSGSSAGSPRFSPDGKFIAYDAQISGGSDVYIVSVNGGAPRRLTDGGKNNSLPAWSVDGQWIFFVSNRSGSDQIWKISSSGGEASQLTRLGAFEMFAAPDGKEIIYSKGGGKFGLWSVSVNGGDEKPIPELAEAGSWRSWFVSADGVYYTAFSIEPPFRIKFFDFAARRTKEFTAVEKPPLTYYSNLTVSPDGKKILYARQDQSASSIMLAELD